MSASLLHYRPWRGDFQHTGYTVWPIARIALWMILRRKLFWGLYTLGLLIFFMFFFGQYLLAWAESQVAEETVRVGLVRAQPGWFIHYLRDILKLNGSADTYRNFFWYQGYMVIILLALAGSILVGNDFHFGTLPFYLAKPLGRWHYLLGKCLAVAVFVNLMTTLPALALYVQFGLLDSWSYFAGSWRQLVGILGYGLLVTVALSLMLVATAVCLRRTVPLIMTWATVFFFLPLLSGAMVHGFHYSAHWQLLDLWRDLYLLGNAFLGGSQPAPLSELRLAALVIGVISLVCLIYLNLRIRAVEVVK
jgi:ABC-type transport system involved in multi-copper enzyme maturation permease subunit